MPSSSAGAVTMSWTCPPVRMRRSGRPSASASMWICWSILLWIAPEPGFGPPFSGRGLLVGTNQRGVEHEVFVLAVFGENVEDAFPDAALGPAGEAGVDALPFSVSLQQIMPVRARAQHPQDTVDEQTIVLGSAARIAGLAREQAFDPPPLCVGQLVPLDHVSCSESSDPEHKESSP